MGKYIMSFDAGTTSNRCILFSKEGEILSTAQKEFRQSYPKPGWVEQDPKKIWSSQISCAVEVLSDRGISHNDIAAIGISNQRETTILWDKRTGEPVYPAIGWQCRRTSDYCDQLIQEGYEEFIREKTGLKIDAYFSATKIRWILENVEGARERVENGEILFGTVDSWLLWKLTKGKVHGTDVSNASRTMLFNINKLEWDKELLDFFSIPKEILPIVGDSSQIYGYTDSEYLGGEIPIASLIGDQQSALFGQSCFEEGEAKNTYGTGAFLLMNTGEKPVYSENGLLTTVAWKDKEGICYAIEGSIFVAGSAIQWLRDDLRIVDEAEDTAYMASKVEDTKDCYFVPAFTGLGAPYWNQYARGTIVGITRGVSKYHIVRAALESIAFLSKDVLEAMEKEGSIKLKSLKVDGGASNNDFLMQFQSDIMNVSVERPVLFESTALGAAYLAGLAAGFWKDKDEIRKYRKVSREFHSEMSIEEREKKYKRWKKAVEYAKNWAKDS